MTAAPVKVSRSTLLKAVIADTLFVAAGAVLWYLTGMVAFVIGGFVLGSMLAAALVVLASRRDPSDMGRAEVEL